MSLLIDCIRPSCHFSISFLTLGLDSCFNFYQPLPNEPRLDPCFCLLHTICPASHRLTSNYCHTRHNPYIDFYHSVFELVSDSKLSSRPWVVLSFVVAELFASTPLSPTSHTKLPFCSFIIIAHSPHTSVGDWHVGPFWLPANTNFA